MSAADGATTEPKIRINRPETTEAFLDGHVSAFAFFGGVPISILYDNLKIVVSRILGDSKRQRIFALTQRS